MSNPLAAFGTYCRRMSTADHVDDCRSLTPPSRPVWDLASDLGSLRLAGFTPTPPRCDGCVTSADRALWHQLATEIAAYLAGDQDHAGLF